MRIALVLFITSWCNVLLITALRNLDLDWRESSPFILDHFSTSNSERSEENSSSNSYEVDKSASIQESSPDGTRRNDEDLDTADSVSSQSKEDPLQAILPKVKFICKGRPEGYYADTDFDCEVFHYCKTSGFRFTFVCPPKSKFNQKQMTCDYEAKDSICNDAIRHQKQMVNQKSVIISSETGEKMSESQESVKSVVENKFGSRNELALKGSEASIPKKQINHTSLTSKPATTTTAPNYYQFTGNSDKYVSPQVFDMTPKVTTPIPTTSPSPVYQAEDNQNSQSSARPYQLQSTASLPSPPFNYSGFQFNLNQEDESFKPINLKGDTFSSSINKGVNNYLNGAAEEEKKKKVSNDQREEEESSSPVSPNPISSPAFSIIWNHEVQNSFSSFKPSQPMQMKYSKSQNYLKPNQEQATINKLKISDPTAIPDHHSTAFLQSPPTIQLHQFIAGKDQIRPLPEKQGQQYPSTLQQFNFNKHNEQPLGYDLQDGMMMSNYDLQPLIPEKTTTTISPMVVVTRAPAAFHKIFAQFPQESFKSNHPFHAFQKLKMKPAASLNSMKNLPGQSSFTNDQLSSFLNSGSSFTSLEELEDLAKFPTTDQMFGLPKIAAPKKQNYFDHEQIPHNFHTQIPHMMPFNNHGMGNNHIVNHQHVPGNSGSFMTELNNLFSKHFTKVRPGNFLPSSSRPPPTISLPKFPPNVITSWFNKPKDINNINLMTSGSQQRPSFVEPPSPQPPPPSTFPQPPKWGIFTSITKFFNSPQPQSSLNNNMGFRPASFDHKFTGSNQMQTVPLNFYQQQGPPRINFQPLSYGQNNTRPAFKLAMSIDPEFQEEEYDTDEKGTESEINPWERSNQVGRKVLVESNQLNVTVRRNDTSRSFRRKRQIFGLKAIETNNIPNMYPIFTSSEYNDNILMSSPSFLDSLTFLPATIVTQRSKNRPSIGNRFVDHSDPFSNPFPTVPLPSFERTTQGKSSKIRQFFIKPDVHQMLPSYSAPPLKYNPSTGTFYEPIFGSEIPIHLTYSDFQRMPDNLLKKPRDERVKASSIKEERDHVHDQNLRPSGSNKREKMPAKVLKYEYMYQPVTNHQPSRKRQPVTDNTVVPLAQVTYEKVNIPPLRIYDEPVHRPKYRVPEKLPVNPRKPLPPPPPPPIKHIDDEQRYKRPQSETPRPRFVASLNSAIDNIVQQNNFDPPRPSLNSERNYHSTESVVDERKPSHYKPVVNYESSTARDPISNRIPPQSWIPEEIPIRQSSPPKFIPYEAPENVNHVNEQSNNGRDVNINEYRYTNEGNQGSQTKLHSTSYGVDKNYDNRDHRYPDTDVQQFQVTTVTPPSSTRSYRPHSFSTRPAQTSIQMETNHPQTSITPVYGQKLHRNNNDNNRFDSNNNLNTNQGDSRTRQKEIVIEKQWYPEAPYTRVYTTPATTSTTERSMTTSPSFSDWPVFKKHQNYLPPVDTGIKPVTLNDFEEETVVDDGHISSSSDRDDQNHKKESNSEYAPKYPETFSVPQHYTTSAPPPSITPSTNMYYDYYPTSESPVDNYSEYPSSVNNYHETKSDTQEVTVKMDHEETTTPEPAKKVDEDEEKKDSRIKVFGGKKNDYTKFLNRYRGSPVTRKPVTTEPTWISSTVTTTASSPPKNNDNSKPVTSYGTRVGATRAPKTKVSVHASISTSSVRKPVYTSNFDSKNRDAQETREYNTKELKEVERSIPPSRKPTIGYSYQSSTTKKPIILSSSSSKRENKVPSRDWTRFRSSSSSTSTTQVPLPTSSIATTSSTTLGTTSSPISTTTTPALFTGKVQNLETLFDTFDGDEALEGDYDVVEEQPSKRDEEFSSPSSTPSSSSLSSTQSFLKVYSSSSAGALNTRLSGLRMKNLFGQKKRFDPTPQSTS